MMLVKFLIGKKFSYLGIFYLVMIGDPKDGDGEPDKMQVAGMRIARFKAWVAGKIKGLFTKRKISAVETNRPTMVSSTFFHFYNLCHF